MKTSLTTVLIIATCLSASAASYTWSGAAGTTDWNTGENWVGGTAPALGTGTAHTINIGNNYTVTNGATLATYSGSHIFNIGNNSNVTISGQTNDNVGNITLGTGSTFTINQSGFLKMRNPASPSEIFGTLTISGASLQCNDTQGSTPAVRVKCWIWVLREELILPIRSMPAGLISGQILMPTVPQTVFNHEY